MTSGVRRGAWLPLLGSDRRNENGRQQRGGERKRPDEMTDCHEAPHMNQGVELYNR